jgi:dihydrofolate reductase
MRNIILLAHVSLDGFMAGPGGDMSFITINEEISDHVYPLTATVDTALYGRVTYQMMEGYWPTVLDAEDADAHQREHARWYEGVEKIVASRTLPAGPRATIVGDDIVGAVRAAKQRGGGDIMIFGSPSLVHVLAAADLIDEWRLLVQPVVLGRGLPLFAHVEKRKQLALRSAQVFGCGVIATHYA